MINSSIGLPAFAVMSSNMDRVGPVARDPKQFRKISFYGGGGLIFGRRCHPCEGGLLKVHSLSFLGWGYPFMIEREYMYSSIVAELYPAMVSRGQSLIKRSGSSLPFAYHMMVGREKKKYSDGLERLAILQSDHIYSCSDVQPPSSPGARTLVQGVGMPSGDGINGGFQRVHLPLSMWEKRGNPEVVY